MMKKAVWLWCGALFCACTSPLEQMPEKILITANPTINLPLGDPLKGSDINLGTALQDAMNIDPGAIGLDQLYTYVDPAESDVRKFVMYQMLVDKTFDLKEYRDVLTVSSSAIEGLPSRVDFAAELPVLPPLPASLPLVVPVDLPTGTIVLEHDKIGKLTGSNSGLSLICSGSQTKPEYITMVSQALNLNVTKEKRDITLGSPLTFTGGDFSLEPEDGKITIDIAISMGFKDIVDTKAMTIKPGIIFHWTEAELNLGDDIPSSGSFPEESGGGKGIDLAPLKTSLFNGKLQFDTIPLYLYLDGPAPWFTNGNITLALSAASGEGEPTPLENKHETLTATSPPVFEATKTEYRPSKGLASLPSSFETDDLTAIFNAYPENLRFNYAIEIGKCIVNPDMLKADRLGFKAALVMALPLRFTITDDIDVAEDMDGFAMPDFGTADMFGRESADASAEAFDFIERISVDMTIHNALGLDGMVYLYANSQGKEAGKTAALGEISMTGVAGSVLLSREDLKKPANYPFSPAFEIIIPQGTEFSIKRVIADDPFSIFLKIAVEGKIEQEIDL
ncbi:MAG: hypothetical protein LBQ30_01905 [Treponema sp.]|jgi:hypothetical protein|nr:hypothetical protein [Treponema sp.]